MSKTKSISITEAEKLFDKDVPMPPNTRGGWPKKYYFDLMQIGESQFLPDVTQDKINPVAQQIKRRLGYKFSIRSVEGGVRIWRIQ